MTGQTVDISAALTADIADLCRYIGLEPGAFAQPLQALSRDLALALGSYVGLQVSLLDRGHPIVLTSFLPGTTPADIATSLRLPLTVLQLDDVTVDDGSEIVLYASTPGAFVDLAADLSYALHLPDPSMPADAGEVDGQAARIRLDGDLTPSSFESRLTGVGDVSTVNRAVGFLMAEGLHPEDAHRELARRAAATGITVLMYASQLIRPSSS